MPKEHTPKIRKPENYELDGMIDAVERRGWYGLLGALLDYKQLRSEAREVEQCKAS